MRLLRLLPAATLLASAAQAQVEPPVPAVDLVAMIFVGFADGATVQGSPDVMTVTQAAPGNFSVATAAGITGTLSVTETTPCVFDVGFIYNGEAFAVRVDAGLIESIGFEAGGSMGLADGIMPYTVKLSGQDGFALRVAADGSTSVLSGSTSIATSIPLVDLEQAALALKGFCPTR